MDTWYDPLKPAKKLPTGAIIRKDLLALLDHSERFPITLLLAPAGSGKSTLLRQWQSMRPSRLTVRYSVQLREQDPAQFFRHFVDAIRQATQEFDVASYSPFSTQIALPPDAIAESLLQALAGIHRELYVILDDFQFLEGSEVPQVISRLVAHLPDSVHFILSSRNYPDFSLSQLKLDDRLLLIDGNDLRLNRSQITEMNRHLGGPDLPEHLLDRLHSLTEGWMAGVKIALLAYARSGVAALNSFNGAQPELVDYFGHVVLRNLPSHIRDFFLQSALFERFSADLCNSVLERSDSAQLLDRMASQELFLIPIENKPGWYRYHTLLNEFLKNRIRIEQPELISEIYHRAAEFHLRQLDTDQALLCAQQSGKAPFFTRILKQCCDEWLREGDFSSILQWVEPLPETQVLGDADLAVPLISALTLSRRFNQARYYLEGLQESDIDALPGRLSDQSTLAFLELSLKLFQHDTDFRSGADLEALASSSRHHDIRAFSLAIIAYHNLLHARFDAAMTYASRAKVVLAQLGYRFLETYADLIMALSDRGTGHIFSAIRTVQDAHEKLRSHPHSPSWINIATARVVILYEQNELEAAQQLCEELLPRIGSSCATEAIATVYLTLSRILHLESRQPRAKRLLDQLARILQLGNYDRFVGQVAQESLLQAFNAGQPETIEELARYYRLPQRFASGYWQEPREYDEGWERYGLATTYWLRANKRLDEAEQILGVIVTALKQCGARARALITEANLVVLLAQRNDTLATFRLLRLIQDYGLLSINRSTFDEAPGFASILETAERQNRLTLPRAYRHAYRNVFSEQAAADQQTEPVNLTGKELEILELLAQGLGNSEISERTGIALSTTKWHLKNIYAKLGVANRTEAIIHRDRALASGNGY